MRSEAKTSQGAHLSTHTFWFAGWQPLDPEKVSGAEQKQRKGRKTKGDPGCGVTTGTQSLLCVPAPPALWQPHNGKESPTAVDGVVGARNSTFTQTEGSATTFKSSRSFSRRTPGPGPAASPMSYLLSTSSPTPLGVQLNVRPCGGAWDLLRRTTLDLVLYLSQRLGLGEGRERKRDRLTSESTQGGLGELLDLLCNLSPSLNFV